MDWTILEIYVRFIDSRIFKARSDRQQVLALDQLRLLSAGLLGTQTVLKTVPQTFHKDIAWKANAT